MWSGPSWTPPPTGRWVVGCTDGCTTADEEGPDNADMGLTCAAPGAPRRTRTYNTRIKRCPVLTGPAGRRQSRGCRSVRGLHAETSIWCPPVHGARAPTEHPKPNIIIVWMSFVDVLTESHGPRTVEPQAGVRLRRSQSGACRVTSANPGSRAPTDHPWISTIPARRSVSI